MEKATVEDKGVQFVIKAKASSQRTYEFTIVSMSPEEAKKALREDLIELCNNQLQD